MSTKSRYPSPDPLRVRSKAKPIIAKGHTVVSKGRAVVLMELIDLILSAGI